jgi:acetylornithine deacetylase/succinyl-diaminopimelate desuccinylase-like protein
MTFDECAVRDAVLDGADEFIERLLEWLRIPSISADPSHSPDVRRSAEWLVDALGRAGFPDVELWETPGHPAVFAQWPSDNPKAPTVLIYGHHDVQPVTPLEAWSRPPSPRSTREIGSTVAGLQTTRATC